MHAAERGQAGKPDHSNDFMEYFDKSKESIRQTLAIEMVYSFAYY